MLLPQEEAPIFNKTCSKQRNLSVEVHFKEPYWEFSKTEFPSTQMHKNQQAKPEVMDASPGFLAANARILREML